MNSQVELRPMQLEDYDEVRSLWEATDGVGLHDPSDSQQQIAYYLERNPTLSRVAVANAEIVGAVLCGHDGRRGYLSHLAVAADFRGQGIGKQIVDECLQGLSEFVPGCNIRLYDDNETGAEFWSALGWTPTGVHVLTHPTAPADNSKSVSGN